MSPNPLSLAAGGGAGGRGVPARVDSPNDPPPDFTLLFAGVGGPTPPAEGGTAPPSGKRSATPAEDTGAATDAALLAALGLAPLPIEAALAKGAALPAHGLGVLHGSRSGAQGNLPADMAQAGAKRVAAEAALPASALHAGATGDTETLAPPFSLPQSRLGIVEFSGSASSPLGSPTAVNPAPPAALAASSGGLSSAADAAGAASGAADSVAEVLKAPSLELSLSSQAAERTAANFSAAAGSTAAATPALPAVGAAAVDASLSTEAAMTVAGEPLKPPSPALRPAPGDSGFVLNISGFGGERAELLAAPRENLLSLTPLLQGVRLDPGAPQFTAALGQQLQWMASQQLGRAELRLDPDDLGPLEIRLEMQGDEIRAEFASRSAEVRSLLETQVPRLRELLAEQGFSLADAQVGQERAAYQDAPQQRAGFAQRDAAKGGSDEGSPAEAPVATVIRRHNGQIDDFA